MTRPLQKWVLKRYKLLWDKFKDTQFDFQEAKETTNDKTEIVSLILSELRRKGRLGTKLDKKKANRRLYKLKPFDAYLKDVIEAMIKEIGESK
ncbi:MAG: hypothetical protein ACREBF_02850 [Candidatus Micrarchaeales archaeon]